MRNTILRTLVGTFSLSKIQPVIPLLLTSAAYGCPFCHTQTGQQVHAGIFNSSFGFKLLAMALPFPVFAAVVAWLHFGIPKRYTASQGEEERK